MAGDDSNAGTTDAPVAESDMVRIATYPPGPRLPSTTEFLPRDFVDSLSFPIGQYIRDIPPEQNGAPELLDALKVLTAELAICFPEPEQNEIARVGAINEANIESWHDEYTMTGKLPTPEQLTPFDPSFRKLVDITRSKELRFYSIHDIELPLLELKVLRLVTRLCHLRARALRDQIPIRQRIDEFRAVLRICRELGHRKVADEFLSFMAIDFAFSTSFRALLFDADLDADASRALVEVITNDLRQFEKSQPIQIARSEQLLFYRFLSRVQETSDAHESLLEAINFSVARGQQNLEMERLDALMTNQLATITPEQLQKNRNAFDAELQHFLQFVQADTGDWWARVQAYQTEEQQRLKTVYSGMEDAMNSGNLNGHPWLAAFIRPPGFAALLYQSYVGASERVALGELAQRISNLDGQPDSLTLSEAMNRLDLSDFRLDPFSGQVLTTVQRDGRRVVYSIGADGRDDQAISLSVGNSPGDIFFASENRESEQP